jgi:hypothetical protein
MLDNFPEKPKGMHWRTYERLCCVHNAAQARYIPGMMGFVMDCADGGVARACGKN